MPMDKESQLVVDLVDAFKIIKRDNGIPDWAWKYSPPVPFVGRNYKKGEGLLVYASAENLSWTKTGKPEHFSDDEKAYTRRWDFYTDYLHHCNRYKGMFDGEGTHVGIGPFDSGGLLVAARVVSKHFGLPMSDEPDKFLEMLAVTNWCKFTILCMAFVNHDYADNVEKLKYSLPYVSKELSMLNPAKVIMPATTYKRKTIRDAIKKECDAPIPLYQFSTRVLDHKCLVKCVDKGPRLKSETEASDPVLADWMAKIGVSGAYKEKSWGYLAHVKSVLREIEKTCEDL